MIELSEAAGGLLSRSYGGDTLNTAVYLARLGVAVDYVTALGDDPWSDEMLSAWRAEGVGTDLVVRVPGRLPGLHIISTDRNGQRSFHYWRDSSPARLLFELPQTADLAAALAEYDVIYLSGVTLSLYGEAGRKRLFEALDLARARGRRIAFDTNFRTRGWPDRALAKAAFRAAIGRADIVLASTEDLDLLFGAEGASELPTSNPKHRGGAQARRACGPHLSWRQAADDRCRAGARRDRHHGRGRQLCRRVSGGTPWRRRAGRGGDVGPPAGGGGRAPPRRDHSPLGDAGRDDAGSSGFRGEASMTSAKPATADVRRTKLEEILRAAPLIPVITIERASDAVPLARALVAGGLKALEITLRTPAAPAAADAIAREVPDAILGLGTVLTAQDLDTARSLNARFALSPGATPELLDAAAQRDLPFIPGVQTASELMAALARGFDVVKFFPAGPAGGIAALRALAGPFPQVRFCPTGGVGADNFTDWLALPNVVSVGGSWLAPAAEIRAGDWAAITARAQRAVAKLQT